MSKQWAWKLYLFGFFFLATFLPELILSLAGWQLISLWWLLALDVLLALLLTFTLLTLLSRFPGSNMPNTSTTPNTSASSDNSSTNIEDLLIAARHQLEEQARIQQVLEEHLAANHSELDFNRGLVSEQTSRLKSRAAEITTLYDVSRASLASSNLAELHRTALQSAAELFHLSTALSSLFDESGSRWHGLAGATAESDAIWKQQSVSDDQPSLSFEVYHSRAPLVINNALGEPYAERYRMKLIKAGSAVFLPMIAPDSGQVIGVIILADKTPRVWLESELEVMQTFCNQLAVATNRAQLNQRLALEHNRLNAVLNSVSESVTIIDNAHHLLMMNRAARTIMGIGANTDLAALPAERYALVSPALAYEAIKDIEKGQIPPPVNVTVGGKIYSVSVSPVYSTDGSLIGIAEVARDATEASRIDRTKTEFISLVSHELRTPLTSLKGYLDLVADGEVGPLNSQQEEFLNIARSNSERLVDMINDLLDVSSIELRQIKIEPDALSMSRMLDLAVTSQLMPIQTKEHIVTVNADPNLPMVWADRSRLHQIIVNLLSNAVKYTPNGGRIQLHAFLTADHKHVRVEVSDNGLGMTAAELDRLFHKFYRSDNPLVRSIKGTGLGLVIAKALIELSGGTIDVVSEYGQGSTFGFTVPVVLIQPSPSENGSRRFTDGPRFFAESPLASPSDC